MCWPKWQLLCAEWEVLRSPWSLGKSQEEQRAAGSEVVGAGEKGTGSQRWRRKLGLCFDKAHLPPHPELLNVILKCSSLFSLDEFAILMILIILKGQQRSFESPSVLSCNQLINWKPFSSVCRARCLV